MPRAGSYAHAQSERSAGQVRLARGVGLEYAGQKTREVHDGLRMRKLLRRLLHEYDHKTDHTEAQVTPLEAAHR